MEKLEEGQIVLCTVDKVIGTSVFVKINDEIEGTITVSEIAPGRIRNLRDYVIPGKRIVCKILSINNNNIQLSLRRVKVNERKDFLDLVEKENNYKAIIKTVVGKEAAEKIIKTIQEKSSIFDYLTNAKENPKLLKEEFTNEQADKIIKILESKKEKAKQVAQIFKLSSKSSEGISLIKQIIKDATNGSKSKVNYLAAGKYRITLDGEDFKEIETEIKKIIQSIEKSAKKQNCDFSEEKD